MPRVDEIENLSSFEANAVPPVLSKKQEKKLREKFGQEGYEFANINLEPLLESEPPQLANLPQHLSFLGSFLRMFSWAMLTDWKDTTNEHLMEKNLRPIKRKEILQYLGIVLRMCVKPLDVQSDHWKKQFKHPRMMSRERFEYVHRNRYFHIKDFFRYINRAFRSVLADCGTEVTLDELLAGWAGQSPALVCMKNKPHQIGHLFNMTAIELWGRPFLIGIIGKWPGFKDGEHKTCDVVQYLVNQIYSQHQTHITTDCFYNTKGVRKIFADAQILYTMAARQDWIPHLWKTLSYKLPEYKWNMAYQKTTDTYCTALRSERLVCTMTTNAKPVEPMEVADRSEPPLPFNAYRQRFNTVDLFNRLFYKHSLPHRQTSWTDHFHYVFVKVAVVNAYTLYCAAKQDNELTLKQFMEGLSEQLINYM